MVETVESSELEPSGAGRCCWRVSGNFSDETASYKSRLIRRGPCGWAQRARAIQALAHPEAVARHARPGRDFTLSAAEAQLTARWAAEACGLSLSRSRDGQGSAAGDGPAGAGVTSLCMRPARGTGMARGCDPPRAPVLL